MTYRRPIDYKGSGVDIEQGNLFVRRIKSLVASTKGRGAIADIGSFSGMFAIPNKGYRQPVLVSSTDGVGTKLMIAQQTGMHKSVGIDLVAMCANDVATTGARPLFFLDYIATGRLDQKVLVDVVGGIARACRETGYSLVGGETAEMPDMYRPGEYDLAGFCVGIIDKPKIIDGRRMQKNDVVLGLASSGPHSNGYSLIRKVFSKRDINRLKTELLKPTRLYVQPLLVLSRRVDIKGIAHITGGSYVDKIPRIIPKGLGIVIRKGSWPVPSIFGQIQRAGSVREEEMYHVFNMGIGMAVVISRKDLVKAQRILSRENIKSWEIGVVTKGSGDITIA